LDARTLEVLCSDEVEQLRTGYGKSGSENWWTPLPEETPRDITTLFLFDPNRTLERVWAGMIGEMPTVRVMFVPDYCSDEKNQDTAGSIALAMERFLPGHRVLMSKAEGPFSDDNETGLTSWFPPVNQHQKRERIILDIRKDPLYLDSQTSTRNHHEGP